MNRHIPWELWALQGSRDDGWTAWFIWALTDGGRDYRYTRPVRPSCDVLGIAFLTAAPAVKKIAMGAGSCRLPTDSCGGDYGCSKCPFCLQISSKMRTFNPKLCIFKRQFADRGAIIAHWHDATVAGVSVSGWEVTVRCDTAHALYKCTCLLAYLLTHAWLSGEDHRSLVRSIFLIIFREVRLPYEHVYSPKHGQPADRQTDRYIQIKTAQTYRQKCPSHI